jgi:hypothetical protein
MKRRPQDEAGQIRKLPCAGLGSWGVGVCF